MGAVTLNADDLRAIADVLAGFLNAPARRGRPPKGWKDIRQQVQAAAHKVTLLRSAS